MWKRYSFETRATADVRPLIFNPRYPWWCTGYAADMSFATIVAYLPASEQLHDYWDDAYGIRCREEPPTFTSRFPRPTWWQE